MNPNIRSAGPADMPAIYKLMEDFSIFQKTPEKLLNTTDQLQNDSNDFKCIVIESGNMIVGFASYFFTYYSWSGKGLYLDDLYIDPSYRGKGFGKKLLDAVFDIARDANCKRVRWQVSRWNSEAIKFYKQIGATVEDTEINCDLSLS